jgi:hypothetical protein
MEPMVIVTWLCGYGFISALSSLIPSLIARSRGKNYFGWWIGSFLGLMTTVFFIQNNICVVPIAVLIVLCVAAFVRLPTNSNGVIER